MDTANALALASAVLATLVAICVSWLAFRFALRQEQVRWLREQRTQLYVELLAEANSQVSWASHTRLERSQAQYGVRMEPGEMDELDGEEDEPDPCADDPRLTPQEKRLLWARANVFASDAVVELWGKTRFDEWADLLEGGTRVGRNEAELHLAYLELITTIRAELGTERISTHLKRR